MAIDKEPGLHPEQPLDAETSKDKKKSKKKKRVPSHVPLPALSEAKAEEKPAKKTSKKAETDGAEDKEKKDSKKQEKEVESTVEAPVESAQTENAVAEVLVEDAATQPADAEIEPTPKKKKRKKSKEQRPSTSELEDITELPPEPDGSVYIWQRNPRRSSAAEGEAVPAAEQPEAVYVQPADPRVEELVRAHEGDLAPSAPSQELSPKPSAATTSTGGGEGLAMASGVATGATVEHVRHTSREKKQAKANQKAQTAQAEQMKQVNQEITRLQEDSEETKQELEETKRELRESKQEARTTRQETNRKKTALEARLERLRTEATAGSPSKERPVANPEDMPIQQPDVRPDRRVETSAWHRIEVDKKTGRPVEDPTIAYGKEFTNEQHQEQLRQQVLEASMDTETVREAYQSLAAAKAAPSPLAPAPVGSNTLPVPQPANTQQLPRRPEPPTRRPSLSAMPMQDIVLAVILAIVVITIFVAL